MLLRVVGRRDDHRRRAVGHLRRVGRGDVGRRLLVGGPRRWTRGNLLERRVATNPLVGIQDPARAFPGFGIDERYRHDLPGKEPVVGVGGRPLVRLQRVLVHLLARDPPLVGEHLRDPELDTERVVRLREELAAERTGAAACVRRHGRTRHRLDAARDPDVVCTRDHTLGHEVRGLLGRTALPVDTGGRNAPRQPRGDPRVARHVATLLA